ncbi:MAG: hypothetical protein H6797_02760 [Candidatus Nomurabacteria bacterium]|nr:MAG: hypothetical protein H6797_02760 [Candidatus Nomurabacteria bacterium]
MTHEKINTTERLATAGTLLGAFSVALLVAEAKATADDRVKGSDKASVISNIRNGEYATFTVPGYHADGAILGKNLDRHFEQMGTTHYAVHPERGFSLDSIREEWLKARALDGHRPARIYALSMGGLLVSKLFSDPEFHKEFGEIDRLVLDSALSGKKDLSNGTKLAMGLGAVLPVTYSTARFYRMISNIENKGQLAHAPEVTDAEVKERYAAGARMHFSAGKDEILFMHNEDVERLDLREAGNEIRGGIIYLQSAKDHLVNTLRSSQSYSNSYEQDIQCRIDTARPLGSHASGPEFPKGAVDALLDRDPNNYRIRTIRHTLPRFSQNAVNLKPAA